MPQRHIVWYVYPTDRAGFRNFVDFEVTAMTGGVRFNIYYYEQDIVPLECLARHRENNTAALQATALAFKAHCESRFARA